MMRSAIIGLALLLFATNSHAARNIFISDSVRTNVSKLRFKNFKDYNDLMCAQGGDVISLRRSEYYRGTLVLKPCPSGRGEVTVQSDGSGDAKAVLTAFADIPDGLKWEKVRGILTVGSKGLTEINSKNLYRLGPFPKDMIADFSDLIIKGERVPLSSLVAKDSSQQIDGIQFNTIRDVSALKLIACPPTRKCALLDAPAFSILQKYGLTTGMYAITRDTNFSFSRNALSWIDPSNARIAYQSDPTYGIKTGYGVAIVNSILFLNKPNRWAYDPGTGYVYYYPPSGYRPSVAQTRFTLSTKSAISADFSNMPMAVTLKDLEIRGGGEKAINLVNMAWSIINRVSIRNGSGNGLYAYNFRGGLLVQDSNFSNISAQGIFTKAIRGMVQIQNSAFDYVGRLGNQRTYEWFFSGIYIYDVNGIRVLNNTFTNMGYAAANFTASNYTNEFTVVGNRITNYCRVLMDCGGFYIQGAYKTTNTTTQNIAKNVIVNGIGNRVGVTSVMPTLLAGIYLDLYASYFNVFSNTIETMPNSALGGILINGGKEVKVFSNIVNVEDAPAIQFIRLTVDKRLDWSMVNNRAYSNRLSNASTIYGTIFYFDPLRKWDFGYVDTIGPAANVIINRRGTLLFKNA